MSFAADTAAAEEHLRFTTQLAALRQEQFSEFDDASLAWLAMPPAWTELLAEAAQFPTGSLKLPEFLDQTERARIAWRGPRTGEHDLSLRRTRALMALWPFLDPTQRERVAPLIGDGLEAVPDDIERLRLEIAIMPFGAGGFSGPEHDSRLESLLTEIGRQPPRLRALLTTRLAAVDRSARAVEAALVEVRAIADAEDRCRLLAALMPAASEQTSLTDEACAAAIGINDPEARADALILLAAVFASGPRKQALQDDAVTAIAAIGSAQAKADALLAALPTLEPAALERTVALALDIAPTIPDVVHRAKVLAALGTFVTEKQRDSLATDLKAVVESIGTILDPAERDTASSAIATAYAAIGRADEARKLAFGIDTPSRRAQALLGIVPYQPDTLAAELVAAAFPLTPRLPRATWEALLAGLPAQSAKYLPRAVASAVLQCIEAMISDGRFEPALRLIRLLKTKDATSLLDRMLNVAGFIGNERDRTATLAMLAAYLSRPMLDRAVEMVAQARPPDRTFCMHDTVRADVLQYLRDRPSAMRLKAAATHAGRAVLSAVERQRFDVAPATMRWAQIASHCDDLGRAADFVAEKVRVAVEVGDLSDALEYAKATTELAGSLGHELELASVQAQHRIGLAFRSAADESHLTRFLPRQEYSDAITEVLGDAAPHWAIHFLGLGGVGKTMLMRQLTGRLAVKDGKRLPTSRVDFDHINPEYPVRKPGELLAVLAEELRMFSGNDQEDRYRKFQGDLKEFHGALSVAPPPDDPLQNIESPGFTRLLHAFTALLDGLPKPVIFILDTCEELAKLDPVGRTLPSVEATFRIIEQVHQYEAGIRVVFAGRRLLARSGGLLPNGQCRWAARADKLPERSKILPKRKDYMRLHVMRGFSEREADDYFSRIIGIALEPDQREAILRRSLDYGLPAEIDFDTSSPASPDAAPRYNPFDLSLYADWVKEDPKVSAQTLGSGETDPYVEMRIMRRIDDDDLRNAIVYAVLLRRFDIEMLRPAARTGGDDLVRLFRDLGGQEWMEYQQDALQVDPKFLPRLQRYFEHPNRRHLLDLTRVRLAPALLALVRRLLDAQEPFAQLAVRHLDAVLRLAPETEAADLWDAIERALFESGNWHWAETVCRSLLDRENAAGDEHSWLHGAVCATYNAVLVHLQPQYSTRDTWQAAIDVASRHPNPQVGAFIELRGRLWTEPLGENAYVALTFEGDDWQREQLGAALVAAIERELETPNPGDLQSHIWRIAVYSPQMLPPEVRAGLACALARCTREPDDVARAKTLAAGLAGRPLHQRWGDWRAPAALASRIRLELLRIDPDIADVAELERWTVAAAEDLDTIDGDRLLSWTLSLRLEYQPVAPPNIATDRLYDQRRRPECKAHFETPPAFGSFVEAAMSRRLDDRWLDLVNDLRTQALASHDSIAVRTADAVRLTLDCRLRTSAATQALADRVPLQHPGCSKFHRGWAVQAVNNDENAVKLLRQLELQSLHDYLRDDKGYDLFSVLDLFEAGILSERVGREDPNLKLLLAKLSEEALPASAPPDSQDMTRFDPHPGGDGTPRIDAQQGPRSVAPVIPGDDTARTRLALRAAAIDVKVPTSWAEDSRDTRPRRLAEIALEEGDLLALRLPDRAIRLFEEAHRLFIRAGDPLGENIGAICAAMAACRAGDKGRAAEWLQRVAPEYREESIGTDEAHLAWRVRAAACAAWIEEPNAVGPRPSWVVDQLARRYGTAIQPELAFAPAAPAQATRSLSSGLKNLVVTAGGLGSLALAVAAVLGVRWFTQHWDVFATFGVVLVILAFEAALIWTVFVVLRPQVNRSHFLMFRQTIVLEPNPDGKGVSFQAEMARIPFITRNLFPETSQWRWVSYILRGLSRPRMSKRIVIERPTFEPYHSTPNLLSRGVSTYLTGYPGLYVAFFIEPSLARYAWEAIIAFSGRGLLDRALRRSIQPVRTGEPLPRMPEGFTAWNTASTRIVARHGHSNDVWTSSGGIDVRVLQGMPIPQLPPLRVLHLIGRARRGTSGPVFSVGGLGGDLGELISIDRLPLSISAIVVVQEEPAERLRRIDIDREQTADARDWAAQVFRAGAQTVIFVPAMPLEVAGRTIGALARKLNRPKAPNVWRLIEAVGTARRAVVRFRPEPGGQREAALTAGLDDAARKQAQLELAMEITLFTRAEEFQATNPFTGFSSTGATKS
jgi:hypothetical protein